VHAAWRKKVRSAGGWTCVANGCEKEMKGKELKAVGLNMRPETVNLDDVIVRKILLLWRASDVRSCTHFCAGVVVDIDIPMIKASKIESATS
jgi:hypothetical protein